VNVIVNNYGLITYIAAWLATPSPEGRWGQVDLPIQLNPVIKTQSRT